MCQRAPHFYQGRMPIARPGNVNQIDSQCDSI